MDDNEGHVPQRRTFVPGVTQPVAPPAPVPPVPPALIQTPVAPDAGAPTEVFTPVPADAGVGQQWGPATQPPVDAGPAASGQEAWSARVESAVASADAAPRPWYRRTWVLATAGGVVAAGIGVGLFVAFSGDGALAADPSPSALPSVTVRPSEDPEQPTLLDDGIAPDDYPEAAPSFGEGYPDALAMEDWVWDKVGPLWTLVSVSNAPGSVVYLASPEGVLFDLVHVGPERPGLTIVSWLEDDRKARIQSYGIDGNTVGGMLNLETGAVDEMSFTMASGQSGAEEVLATTAKGAEVWRIWDLTYKETAIQFWSPADGWQRASQTEDLNAWQSTASDSGAYVGFEVYDSSASGLSSGRSGPMGEPTIVVMEVDSRTARVVRPAYDNVEWCYLSSVTDGGDPIVQCEIAGGWGVYLARDGAALEALDGANLPLREQLVDASEVKDPATGLILTSRHDSSVYVASTATDDGPVPVLRAGEQLPFGGLVMPTITMAGEGVARLSSGQGCALADLENGLGSSLTGWGGDTLGGISCVGFDEGTVRVLTYFGE